MLGAVRTFETVEGRLPGLGHGFLRRAWNRATRVTSESVLRSLLVLALVAFGADVFLSANANPECGFFDIGSPEALQAGRCLNDYKKIKEFHQYVGLVNFGVVTVLFFFKIWQLACYQWARMPRMLRPSWLASSSSWVCAASPDLFAENSRKIHSSNLLAFVLIFPFALAVVTSQLISDVRDFRSTASRTATMCSGSAACIFAAVFGPTIQRSSQYIGCMAVLHVFTLPAMTWSSSMKLAAGKMGDGSFKRLMWLPLLTTVAVVVNPYLTFHHDFRIRTLSAGFVEVFVLFGLQVSYLVLNLLLGWLAMVPQDAFQYIWQLMRPHKAQVSDTEGPGGSGSEAPLSIRGVLRTSEGSQLRVILLFVQIMLWAEGVLTGRPIWLLVVVSVLRIAAGCLMLFAKEQETAFEGIQDKAGFGLVVKAGGLRRALLRKLKRLPPLSQRVPRYAQIPKLLGAPAARQPELVISRPQLRRYKATLIRMQDTLAVSYRWQRKHAKLADGCDVNMSKFQMRALLVAIDMSGAEYVWLDCLSVPQEDCNLKLTLLVRMLAVYASAKCTLAIRTAEEPGSRYHERAWTCQEFCVAPRLLVMTEPDAPNGCKALDGGDHVNIEALRAEYQRSRYIVTPLWLQDSTSTILTERKVQDLLAHYQLLDGRLGCHVPGDKIRALVPLLALSPVESHRELVELVLKISQISGEELDDWKRKLLEHHIASWNMRTIRTMSWTPPNSPSSSSKARSPHGSAKDSETAWNGMLNKVLLLESTRQLRLLLTGLFCAHRSCSLHRMSLSASGVNIQSRRNSISVSSANQRQATSFEFLLSPVTSADKSFADGQVRRSQTFSALYDLVRQNSDRNTSVTQPAQLGSQAAQRRSHEVEFLTSKPARQEEQALLLFPVQATAVHDDIIQACSPPT